MRSATSRRLATLVAALALLGVAPVGAADEVGAADRVGPADRVGAAAAAAAVAAHPVFGPALAFRSPAATAADRALAVAEDDLRRVGHGLSADVVWRPGVRWRGAGDDALVLADADWQSELSASFAWRADAVAVVRARIAVHRAILGASERANRDLRDAVGLHVDLQRAHIARTIAEDAAAGRLATLATAEAVDLPALMDGAERGDADPPAEPRTLLASRLEAERAVAAVERAARDLAEAARRAGAAGFDVEPAAAAHRDRLAPLQLEGWRLWLPDADPLATPAVARAALELAAAEATARRVRVGGILDDLRLDATHVAEDARLRATLRLDEGRPGASFELALRPANRASWNLGISAVVRLDDALVRDRASADVAVAAAAEAWAAAVDEAPWALERARRSALDAEEDVAFAERGLALARLGLREALDAWRARTAAGDAADRPSADAALARAAVALERERDAFYRAWSRYLLEAERFWSAAGLPGGVLTPP